MLKGKLTRSIDSHGDISSNNIASDRREFRSPEYQKMIKSEQQPMTFKQAQAQNNSSFKPSLNQSRTTIENSRAIENISMNSPKSSNTINVAGAPNRSKPAFLLH